MSNTIRKKTFKSGDIVYWVGHLGNGRYVVKYGMVYEHFSDAVVVDFLAPRERRRVNGIPIDLFESEHKRKKLPKGWTYNTRLYEMTYDDLTQEELSFKLDIRKTEMIKEAYDKGYLVKDETIFHGIIEEDITSEGYRLIKKYPRDMHHIDYASINPWKVYFTFSEADQERKELEDKFLYQTKLTDYEWSVKEIENTLERWEQINDETDDCKNRIKDFLLNMKDIEKLETRIFESNIQWKYENNKRWNNIDSTIYYE